jgi:uncharacterized small protein (TIGR04563 family)
MASTEKQKQSLYFPDEMLREIMSESTRLDRSLSWTVQQAWRLARTEVRKLAAPEHRPTDEARPQARDSGEPTAARAPRPSQQVLEFLKGKFDRDLTH